MEREDATPSDARRFPIVGVGASAGGIDPLEVFLRKLPPDAGAAVVIVVHLDPRRASMLTEILGRAAQVPVREAEDGALVEPGVVYVIPPNAALTLEGRRLQVKAPSAPRHASVDAFFTSLAEQHGEAAIGIVLSGAGTDGAAGLRAIKEHGGVTMAQTPEEARADGMPRSAIGQGVVDWILPADEMPEKIVAYANTLDAPPPDDVAAGLRAVLSIVQRKTGHDFAQYKQATMLRRVQRRMRIAGAASLAAYAEMLRQTSAEVDRLFGDLLIGVTRFFRDPDVFEAIARDILPALLRDRADGAEIRVWVAGCATGEEAYSFAILLCEAFACIEAAPRAKIFATDIDDQALDLARQGRYPPNIAADVSAERLTRHFHSGPDGYQVTKEVRDLCVFSTHNLVGDPPFSRVDILSCRNLLIYLETEIQKKLVPLFHYALAPDGYLVLGPSETLAAYAELFRVADKEHRIFQRLNVLAAPAVAFPLSGPRRRGTLERALHAALPSRAAAGEQAMTRDFERVLLEQFAPPAVLVNREGKILCVSGGTGRFLQLPRGAPRTDLIDMALLPLRPSLYAALHRAVGSGKPTMQEGLTLELGGKVRSLDLIVQPMSNASAQSDAFLVVFREKEPIGALTEPTGEPTAELVVDLQRELLHTREHLQTTIEELESGSEELQSANEELLSTNEELQSANEELQTSKEEQQSINEELQTVNIELVRKVEELDRVNSDLKNLFASTQIATLFLDGDLRIKRFSPTATELLRVIDSDVGRPIADIAAALADGDLVAEAREVLATLSPKERQVERAGRWYSRRIRPYRSRENVIDGVVIALIDVTDLKLAQERLAGLAAIVASSQDAIVGVGPGGDITTWNAGAERIYGYAEGEAVGMPFSALLPPDTREALDVERARAARGEHVEVAGVEGLRKDGRSIDVFLALSPVRDASGEVVGLSAIAHDVTERLTTERALQRSEDRLRRLSEADVLSVAFLDREGRISDANDAFLGMFGVARDDLARGAVRLDRLVRPEQTGQVASLVEEMWTEGRCAAQEIECVRADGSGVACMLGGARLEGGAEGVVFLIDVTERRRAMDELRRSEERLRLVVEATMLGTWELDTVTGALVCSPRARELWCVGPDEEVSYETRLTHVHPDDRRAVIEATQRALDPSGSGEYRVDYRVLVPGGGMRFIEAWGRAFFSEAGGFRRAQRLIGTLLDVTERRQVEEALKEADRRKDRFLAVLGHELRNPLAPIRNAVHVMSRVSAEDAAFVRSRAIIDRQVGHMTHLLDDLLEVGRLSAGKISLRKERFDLTALLRATVEDQRHEADAAALTLTAELPEHPLWVVADATRVAQSVTNLLVNAVKFTPRGGHVALAAAAEPGCAVVTVADDGVGIEPEMMERLFEPFSQADRSLDRSRGGLGLGLSLVKAFVEMHGGSVGVRSEGRGKGATFTLSLPLAAQPPAEAPRPEGPRRPRRVLVIEDNADAAESMTMALELSGHTARAAPTGAEGVALARTFRPEIVFCDIGLPGELDGYGVARALRADPQTASVRLIALTGYGQEDDKRRAHEAGFERHLTKPINLDMLDQVVEG